MRQWPPGRGMCLLAGRPRRHCPRHGRQALHPTYAASPTPSASAFISTFPPKASDAPVISDIRIPFLGTRARPVRLLRDPNFPPYDKGRKRSPAPFFPPQTGEPFGRRFSKPPAEEREGARDPPYSSSAAGESDGPLERLKRVKPMKPPKPPRRGAGNNLPDSNALSGISQRELVRELRRRKKPFREVKNDMTDTNVRAWERLPGLFAANTEIVLGAPRFCNEFLQDIQDPDKTLYIHAFHDSRFSTKQFRPAKVAKEFRKFDEEAPISVMAVIALASRSLTFKPAISGKSYIVEIPGYEGRVAPICSIDPLYLDHSLYMYPVHHEHTASLWLVDFNAMPPAAMDATQADGSKWVTAAPSADNDADTNDAAPLRTLRAILEDPTRPKIVWNVEALARGLAAYAGVKLTNALDLGLLTRLARGENNMDQPTVRYLEKLLGRTSMGAHPHDLANMHINRKELKRLTEEHRGSDLFALRLPYAANKRALTVARTYMAETMRYMPALSDVWRAMASPSEFATAGRESANIVVAAIAKVGGVIEERQPQETAEELMLKRMNVISQRVPAKAEPVKAKRGKKGAAKEQLAKPTNPAPVAEEGASYLEGLPAVKQLVSATAEFDGEKEAVSAKEQQPRAENDPEVAKSAHKEDNAAAAAPSEENPSRPAKSEAPMWIERPKAEAAAMEAQLRKTDKEARRKAAAREMEEKVALLWGNGKGASIKAVDDVLLIEEKKAEKKAKKAETKAENKAKGRGIQWIRGWADKDPKKKKKKNKNKAKK